MDRASGSGVFARDADALIDLLPLAIPEGWRSVARHKYGDRVAACRAEFTLREFATPDPINCFFSYPLLVPDEDGLLDEAQAADVVRALDAGRAKGSMANRQKKEQRMVDLREIIRADRAKGQLKSMAAYAEQMELDVRTISRYIREDPETRDAFQGPASSA